MAKFARYALASVCFAASVGCLALWWRANAWRFYVPLPMNRFQVEGMYLEAWAGTGVISLDRENLFASFSGRKAVSNEELRAEIVEYRIRQSRLGNFGRFRRSLYFPIWYPALIFALTGVGALRFRRQFSIRSALIAVTVVAALLGMAVGL
jgi:hypothetical protein